MVWAIVAGLIVVLAAGGIVVGTGGSSKANRGTRAVIVPTDDATRTVIVTPCGTGTRVASRSAASLMNTTGTTAFELPRGGGLRIVLVPRCSAGSGGSAGTSSLPSAAFLARPGTAPPPVRPGNTGSASRVADPGSAQAQLTVPPGSPLRTIVVAPCEKGRTPRPAEQVLGPARGSTTAVAPPC